MPAGDYRIFHPGNPYVIVIEKTDTSISSAAYVQTSAMNSGETSTKLLFNTSIFWPRFGPNGTGRSIRPLSAARKNV